METGSSICETLGAWESCLGLSQARVWLLALAFTSCVTLGKFHNLSEPHQVRVVIPTSWVVARIKPKSTCKTPSVGASLVAQGLRIRLPVQGTQVRSLVREDPTCRGATKLLRHNYWACALEPVSHNYWAHMLQLLKPTRLEPVLCSKRSHRNKKPAHCNEE